jgi:hypothetical protein
MVHLFEMDVIFYTAHKGEAVRRGGLIVINITPTGFVSVDISPSLAGDERVRKAAQELVRQMFAVLRPDVQVKFTSQGKTDLTVEGIPDPEVVTKKGRDAGMQAVDAVEDFFAKPCDGAPKPGVSPVGGGGLRPLSRVSLTVCMTSMLSTAGGCI